MTTYSVTLTHAEDLALGYISLTQQEWVENAVKDRCRIAIDDIVAITVQKCLENNIQLPSTKDNIVILAFEKGWVKSGSERHAEAMNNLIISN